MVLRYNFYLIYTWVKLTTSLHEITTSLQMKPNSVHFIKNELNLLYPGTMIKQDTMIEQGIMSEQDIMSEQGSQ